MKYLEVGKGIVISEIAYSTIVFYSMLEINEVRNALISKETISAKTLQRHVNIELGPEGVIINVMLNICYGKSLEDICKKVQNTIIEMVSTSVGFAPYQVNTIVNKVVVCE